MPTKATPGQQKLELRTWGGRRPGAGPKRRRAKAAVAHRPRPTLRPYQPAHVTVRMAERVWNLRSQRCFAIFQRAVAALRRRPDVRVVHFSVLGNHLHLIVEAAGSRALATAMRSFSIRFARAVNRLMSSRGPTLEDRYHVHPLRTPAEVRNAVRYVLGNYASHARRRGEPVPSDWTDPYSSAVVHAPRSGQLSLWSEPVTEAPRTWLLRSTS